MPTKRLKTAVLIICDALGCSDAELTIVVTDDAAIRVLNREWRKKDQPTDVLSFSQMEGETPAAGADQPTMLGDVVISAQTAACQAEEIGHDFEAEIWRLLVHGVLHLLGYDHVRGGKQAARMRAEERRLLRLLEAQIGPAGGEADRATSGRA